MTTRNLGPCSREWGRPTGTSRNATAPNVGQLFFPQTQALGIDCGNYSPAVYQMIIFAGIKHPSFGQGSEALAELAGLTVPEKQVERGSPSGSVTERVAERECEVQAFLVSH